MYCTIASSISSPAIRTDFAYTIPDSEMTATSVVPPPMSTIMFPPGSWIGRPAPMAAAPGSLPPYTPRAPPRSARAPRPGPPLHRRVSDRTLLDLGDSRRHAHDDARPHECAAPMHLGDE